MSTITVESLSFLHKSVDQTTFSIDINYSTVRPQLIEWTIYSGAATTLCPGAGQGCADKIYKGESIIGASDCPVSKDSGTVLKLALAIDNGSVIDNLCFDGYLSVKAIGKGDSSSDDNALSVSIWKSPEPCTLDYVSFTRGDVSNNKFHYTDVSDADIQLELLFNKDVEPCSFVGDEIKYTAYMQVITSLGRAVMVTQEDLDYDDDLGGVYIDVSHSRITEYAGTSEGQIGEFGDSVDEILVALVKNRIITENTDMDVSGVRVTSEISNTLTAQDKTRPSAPQVVITNYQQDYSGDMGGVFFEQNEYIQKLLSVSITPGFNNDSVDVNKYECKMFVNDADVAKDTIYVAADKYRNVIGTFDLSWAEAADDGALLTIVVTPQAQYIDSNGVTQDSATGYSSEIAVQLILPGAAATNFKVTGGLADLCENSISMRVAFGWDEDEERDNVDQDKIKFMLFVEDVSGVVQNLGTTEANLKLSPDGGPATMSGAAPLLNYFKPELVPGQKGINYDQLANGVVQDLLVELISTTKAAADGTMEKLFGKLSLLDSAKFYLVAAQPLKHGYGYKYKDGFSGANIDDNVYGYGSEDVLLGAPVSFVLHSLTSAPTLEEINGIDVNTSEAWAVSNTYILSGYASQHTQEQGLTVQYFTKNSPSNSVYHTQVAGVIWTQDENDSSRFNFEFPLDLINSSDELTVITLASAGGGVHMSQNPSV